ncbi:MAG: ribosome biogenesis protein [Candidatus Diapherotrites archaeon]|nr:ribosome biogenesis protein [Candidatus Diapherotrites archaeon]
MKRLRYCDVCNSYTMKEIHCNKPTRSAYPAKFSPEDKWAKYRKKARGLA